MSEPRIIELDPAIWHRGDAQSSFLLRHGSGPRSQCCLGIACSQLGIDDRDIIGKGCLRDVDRLPPILDLHPTVAGKLYGLNDTSSIDSDMDRVERLNSVLITAKAPLRFVLKVETATPPLSEASPSVPSEAPEENANASGRS